MVKDVPPHATQRMGEKRSKATHYETHFRMQVLYPAVRLFWNTNDFLVPAKKPISMPGLSSPQPSQDTPLRYAATSSMFERRIIEFYIRILIKIFLVKGKSSSLEHSSIRRSALFWDFTQQSLLGPWKRDRQVVSKRRWGINILRRVQSQKSANLISIAVEVCNHTFQYDVLIFSDVHQERERSTRFSSYDRNHQGLNVIWDGSFTDSR